MNQPRAVTADMMPVVASDGTPHWFLDHFSQVTGGNYEAARLLDIDLDSQNAAKEFIAGKQLVARRARIAPGVLRDPTIDLSAI